MIFIKKNANLKEDGEEDHGQCCRHEKFPVPNVLISIVTLVY
jgi:hypothetical protein